MPSAPRDRTTPIISVQLKLPGKSEPERLPQLDVGPGGTSRFLDLAYESNEKGTDKLKLTINNYDLRFPDDPIFDRGNTIYVSWGYAGNRCPPRECVIVDWTPGHPSFLVEARSSGVLMNRLPVDATYDGKTISQIVTAIATRNGYGPEAIDVEESGVVYETLGQHNMTDAQFCQQLALKIGWLFHVDDAVHFHPRRFNVRPSRVFQFWADGTGDLLKYPSFEKMPAAQPGAVTVKGIDPVTKKPFAERADNASTKDRPGLADVIEVIDGRTAQTDLRPGAAREAVVSASASNAQQAKAIAEGAYRKAQQNPKKCTAEAVGDPQFFAKQVGDIRGISARLSGNYYASQVMHSVKAGQFTMTIKFRRDGTSGTSSGAKSSAKVQTGKGPAGGAQQPGVTTVEVIDGRTGQTGTKFVPTTGREK